MAHPITNCKVEKRAFPFCILHFAFCISLLASSLLATTTSSSLTGTVFSQGGPAPGVTVTVTSKSLQHERTTVTGANGTFWLEALPPGTYDVTFSRAGLQTLTRRAVVELARVARADATLEPSEEGESITSTAKAMNVNETTAITTHFPDRSLDRLPIRRDPLHAMTAGPGPFTTPLAFVDNAQTYSSDAYGEESIEQITILRGALPVEYERFAGTVPVARTHSGGEDFSLSLRDTITNTGWVELPRLFPPLVEEEGVQHFLETASGGRIIRDKLWFFASGWSGDSADRFIDDERGYLVKLTGQAGASHNFVAARVDSERPVFFFSDREDSTLSLTWTGVAGPRLTLDAVANRTTAAPVPGELVDDALFARASYFFSGLAGDHLVRAGFRATDFADVDTLALFVADRWSMRKLTLDFGVRHESGSENDSRLTPRVAATYDLAGDGRRAIVASWSDYNDPRNTSVVTDISAGYAFVVGSSGSIRVDALRRDFEGGAANGAQADFIYRLFDRFEIGANYVWLHFVDIDGLGVPEHTARAWFGADFPIGEHLLAFTFLERFDGSTEVARDRSLTTDLALRYAIPFPRFALTLGADISNVFGDRGGDLSFGRSVRTWVRLGI